MTDRKLRHPRFLRKLSMASAAVAAVAAVILASGWSQAQTSPDPNADIAARRAEQARQRREVPVGPKLLANYAGSYQLPSSALFAITVESDHLVGQLNGQPPVEFYPESEKKFFAKGAPAQISFLTDAQGKGAELVLHQNGFETHAKWIDDAEAKRVAAALAQRIKDNRPLPGSEAALRHHIEAMMAGEPDYAHMTPELAEATRARFPKVKDYLQKFGPIESISFERVTAAGTDVYDVTCEHGSATWIVAPATADGKLSGLAGTNFIAR